MEVKTMKIYVRERQKVGEGGESPKYRVVAVTGGEIQVEATHFRKFEIEQIAKDVGAEVVFMKPVVDDHKKKK
jgi:predicted secreted protein